MKVDLGIWSKLTRGVIFLLFVAGMMLVGVWYLPLIHKNERMRAQILRLDTQIRKEEETTKQLTAAIDALRFSPKPVEPLARVTLRYAKPGETVIYFEEASTNRVVKR